MTTNSHVKQESTSRNPLFSSANQHRHDWHAVCPFSFTQHLTVMGSCKRILVVDDSKTSIMMTTTLLQRESYEVLVADNGENGVAVALSQKPDLIVMDIVMPKMDGLEACRHLRQIETTRDIPIIVVTTRGEDGFRVAGYDSGCDDYITKPINAVEFMSKVKRYLNR
jgi:CheY-like chemotaxis protein